MNFRFCIFPVKIRAGVLSTERIRSVTHLIFGIFLHLIIIIMFVVRKQVQGLIRTIQYYRSLHFLKGNDERLLNVDQQKQIADCVDRQHWLSSSFLIFNEGQTIRKINKWNQLLPWIRPYYAMKSNPASYIIKTVSKKGCGIDCASKGQIRQAFKYGVKPEDIVYSNPVKQPDDIRWAKNNNIKLTTADTIQELLKVKSLAPKMKILWRLAIKEASTDKLSTPFSGKFGDDIDTIEEIEQRMKQIQQLNVSLEGIHFHCGSGAHGSSAFDRAIQKARKCMQIGRKYGHAMKILDCGGGYPAGQLNQKTLKALQVTKDDPLGYTVYAEPGRHLSANTFYLCTRIIGKKIRNNKTCYTLNESVYDSFNCNLMDGVSFENLKGQYYSSIDVQTRNNYKSSKFQDVRLNGMTTEEIDVLTRNIQLPIDMQVKDWLCFGGMGAYTFGERSAFSGMVCASTIHFWKGSSPLPLSQQGY